MSTISIPALNVTLEKTHDWLRDLADEGHFEDEGQAYSALRAVLHALRDRLPVGEAAQLAAQMPMLVRGLCYEGWKPAGNVSRERTAPEFIATVRAHLRDNTNLDPAHAINAVFSFLKQRISAGEIDDIRQILPREIGDLWE